MYLKIINEIKLGYIMHQAVLLGNLLGKRKRASSAPLFLKLS